ncbi:MAG TPA: nitroreductase family protein [Deltaproteobacteria bacterium]|nr:nitroreductase family protein [Deltaproteobacteria bacterium]
MDAVRSIKERRSVNFFEKDVEVADEKIKELLGLAALAPSSFNLQPWEVVVVRSAERKKALRRCAMDQPKVEEASFVLIIVADPHVVEKNAQRVLDDWQQLGYVKDDHMRAAYRQMMDTLYGTPDSVKRRLFALKNASLFAMNLMLAAKAMGMETHPMDGFDEDAIKKEFNIEEGKLIPMLVAAGYLRKGIELLPRAFRKGVDEFARFE